MDLVCVLCSNNYDFEKHLPRFLSCGHTYCSFCLEYIIANGNSICPSDHTPIATTSVLEIPKNKVLLKLLKAPLPEKCSEHKKDLEFFCFQDNQKVCSKCALFGDHKEHDIKPLEDLNEEIEKRILELNALKQGICQVEADLEGNLMLSVEKIQNNFQAKKDQLLEFLSKEFQKLKKRLSKLETVAFQALNKNFEYIEEQIFTCKEVPKLVDSKARNWKDRIAEVLSMVEAKRENPNYTAFELFSPSNQKLFQSGNSILKDLKTIKDLQIGTLEELVESLTVSVSRDKVFEICKVSPAKEVLLLDSSSIPSKPLYEHSFEEALWEEEFSKLKSQTSEVVDFSKVGDLNQKLRETIPFVTQHTKLKSLNLSCTNIPSSVAVDLLKAVASLPDLESVDLSYNALNTEVLEAVQKLRRGISMKIKGNPYCLYT